MRQSRDQEKANRSNFGTLLYEMFLDKYGIKQWQLADKSKINESEKSSRSTLSRMVTGVFAFDDILYDQLYNLFRTLHDEWRIPISDDQVRKLLAAIPTFPSIHLTSTKPENLIRQLIEEGIIRQEYKTKWGTELIGRHNDIDAVFKMLKKGVQFITLVGIPGVGKTEIALQIEKLAKQWGYINVKFISLEQVKSSEEMLRKIDGYLGSIDTGQLTLLLLDNCDDIEDIERVRGELYSRTRNNTYFFIIATSRVTFSAKEHEVEALKVPDSEEEELTNLLTNETVQLFLEEVQGVVTLNEHNAPDIASLCNAVGGLPQSLKIAAPLVRLKGEEEIRSLLKHIENRTFLKLKNLQSDNKRQETLNALIGTIYAKLGADGQTLEQKLLRGLGIFIDGCCIPSLLAVCNLEGNLPTREGDPDIINALAKLASHNLIIFGEKKQLRYNHTKRWSRVKKHENHALFTRPPPLNVAVPQIKMAHASIRDFVLEITTDEEREVIRKQYIHYFYDVVIELMIAKLIRERRGTADYFTLYSVDKSIAYRPGWRGKYPEGKYPIVDQLNEKSDEELIVVIEKNQEIIRVQFEDILLVKELIDEKNGHIFRPLFWIWQDYWYFHYCYMFLGVGIVNFVGGQ